MELGLLLIRVVVGGLLAGHGVQKLFGRLGGLGLDGTGGYLATHGFLPGRPFAALAGLAELIGGLFVLAGLAALAGLAELIGGLFLLAGLATPLAAALVVATMIVAARTDHVGKGLWIFNGGAEYALTMASIGLGLAIVGPGSLSIDNLVGIEAGGPAAGLLALAIAAIGATAVLMARTRPMVGMQDNEPAPPDSTMDGMAA
jgi:putative oxidoreductase